MGGERGGGPGRGEEEGVEGEEDAWEDCLSSCVSLLRRIRGKRRAGEHVRWKPRSAISGGKGRSGGTTSLGSICVHFSFR